MTDTYTPMLTDDEVTEIITAWRKSGAPLHDICRAVERAAIEAYRRRFERATVPENSQDWARLDGAVAWHLIERHADGWADVERMMGEFVAAKIEAYQRQQWRPIDSAPKDGAWILAINAKTNPGRQHVVHYSERHGNRYPWVTDSGPMGFVAGVTHWMPLPPAPEGS